MPGNSEKIDLMRDDHSSPAPPVLILGGGIHGAAVARELILNGIPVVLADTGDLAGGATSKSSRLIHGGLRYLEYGDVGLVRESLVERQKLLELAPQFVRPLRLYVPTSRRWSGLLRSALGFFKLARTGLGRRLISRAERRAPRGYWPVRIGLWMYDLFSWGDGLPKSAAVPIPKQDSREGLSSGPPRVDARRYRWMCAYSDAQMVYPERCVVALLSEAQQVAEQSGIPCSIIPHARIEWHGESLQITSTQSQIDHRLSPAMVINCSGAWGDLTLKGIDPGTTPLFAGTKGSHFVTRHGGLRRLLGDHGVYAETGDRRLAFILPFGDAVLVGTTDERWSGPPDTAVASEEELQYLLQVVDGVFGIQLNRDDIESHYSGVRPLPRTGDTSNSAISRDHSLAEHRLHGVTILTLVGGKLTTFRSVAEQIADRVLSRLGVSRKASTVRRTVLGGEDFPVDPSRWLKLWQQWAGETGTTLEEVRTLWPLYGMRTRAVLAQVADQPSLPIADSPLTRRTVSWVIQHEWVMTLDDLIERRLMLIFAPGWTRQTIEDLADCLVESGRLIPENRAAAIMATIERIRSHYGRAVG
jgi:glycerol-3-phosphate dehydrogenase